MRVALAAAIALLVLSSPGAASVPGGFSFAAVGDIGASRAASATLRGVAAAKPSFFLALGDLSYDGQGSEQRWCRFVRQRIPARMPVEIVSGNHEDDTGKDGRIDAFARCLPDRLGATGEYAKEYWFDYLRLARFIVISPDRTIDGKHYFYGADNAHIRWLRRTIDDARSRRIPWVIVAMHTNCISVGKYYCRIYQELFSLLISKRVDLVLHAHDHTYQRTYQLVTNARCHWVLVDAYYEPCIADRRRGGPYVKGKGSVFVVAGSGGAPLYPVDSRDPEAGYFAATMGSNRSPRHGFLQVSVTRQRLEARFVGSTNTSAFADRFTIRRPG